MKIIGYMVAGALITGCSPYVQTSELNEVIRYKSEAFTAANGNEYKMNIYIEPFQTPFHVRVRASEGSRMSADLAESIAVEYARKDVCKEDFERAAEIDQRSLVGDDYIIGITC